MTDLDALKALLDDFGVPYDVTREGIDGEFTIDIVFGPDVLAESNPKVDGYGGFVTVFSFTPEDGKFVKVGVWE